jgi:hypothetical protein
MSVRQLMTQAVVVQPMGPSTTDAYGNSVQGALGSPVDEFGYLDQKDTIEYLNDRDTVVTKWKAFLHPESVVTAFSTLTFQGQLFQVDGAPYHVYNPRTRQVSHIECKLTEMS